jgi:hypothetical protein
LRDLYTDTGVHMNTVKSHSWTFAVALLLLPLFIKPEGRAQTSDSSASMRANGGALQFQLIGGVGIYYIGECSSGISFRVGANAHIQHTTSSGTNESMSAYSGGTGPSTMTGKPDQSSSSYDITVSGLFIHTIAEYAHTSLYCGAGPMGSYSEGKITQGSITYSYYPTESFTSTNAYTERTIQWSVGPLAIIGIRARLFAPVSLSAEISAAAVYQWWSTSSTSTTQSSGTGYQYTSINVNTSNSDLKGWSIVLNNIQIGVLIEL